MRRFQEAFKALAELRSAARGFNTKVIKESIGDSISNNRTITVSQAIRFSRKVGSKRLALLLETTTAILEQEILGNRRNRSDAIDLGELVDTYRDVVMSGKRFRREIGSAVARISSVE
jgi:hypothetical protein